MIVRPYYLDMLKTYRDVPLVKILAGIRRCGKSTILDMLKDDLLGSGIAVYDVGDGKQVANIQRSTSEAYEVTRML